MRLSTMSQEPLWRALDQASIELNGRVKPARRHNLPRNGATSLKLKLLVAENYKKLGDYRKTRKARMPGDLNTIGILCIIDSLDILKDVNKVLRMVLASLNAIKMK